MADNQQLIAQAADSAAQRAVAMMAHVPEPPGIIEYVAGSIGDAAEYVGQQVKPDPTTTQGTIMAGMWFALGGMLVAPLAARAITWAGESLWDGLKGPRDWVARQIGPSETPPAKN